MVFNTTFNNISVISWWSVLLVEETGAPGENHRPTASHRQLKSPQVMYNKRTNQKYQSVIKRTIFKNVYHS